MIYFTSDLHFSHRNVITYCNRPWSDVESMNEGLVTLWNEQVKSNDIVFVLGDLSLSPKAMEQYSHRLNGIKRLIPGNHDAVFPFNGRDLEKKIRRYNDAGWNVFDKTYQYYINKTEVLLTHLPPVIDNSYDLRYMEYRPVYDGWVLHGHLHSRYLKRGKHIDVGIDNNFKLLSVDDILNIMNDERDFIPSRLTEFYKERDNNDKV